jgi:hypothetical protein
MSKALCRLNPKNTLKHRDPCTCHRCQHFFNGTCPEEAPCESCKGTKKWMLGVAACKNVVPIDGFRRKIDTEKDGVVYYSVVPNVSHAKEAAS